MSITQRDTDNVAALKSAFKWGSATIQYTFDLDVGNASNQYTASDGTSISNVNAVTSSTIKNAFIRAFSEWSRVANVQFQEVKNPAANFTGLKINIGNAADGANGMFDPLNSTINNANLFIKSTYTSADYVNGGAGFYTALHEIGHVLGLDDVSGGDYTFDSTTMNANQKLGQATPMLYDILAVQSNYGVRNSNTAATTYVFNGDTVTDGTTTWGSAGVASKVTIWDNGTTQDIFNASSYVESVRLDLRVGYDPITHAHYYSAVGNTEALIAVGTNIEIARGGLGADTIIGNSLSNAELRGNGGNDTIWGDGDDGLSMTFGADTLYGDAGADTLYGDNGKNVGTTSSSTVGGGDKLYGGDNNDYLYGEGGNDTLYGDAGVDRLIGGQGNDSLYGGKGNDSLWGGLGSDRLYGEAGNDTIYAYSSTNTQNDTSINYLYGGDGNDSLIGGAGADVFDGGAGIDTINGGAGNDTFTIGFEQDIHNGGTGFDTFKFAQIDYIITSQGIISDDDNQFKVDINYQLETVDLNYGELFSISADTSLNNQNTTLIIGNGFTPGSLILWTVLEAVIENPGAGAPVPMAIFYDVGKDLEYGTDLLKYLYTHNMIDISGLLNGDFTIDVGHTVTTTAEDPDAMITANITENIGDSSANKFIATSQTYTATIKNFSASQGDVVDITAFDGTVTSLSSLGITGTTSATLNLSAASKITLTGVAASSITAAYFLSNTLNYGTGLTLNGSSGNDMIYGTSGNDTIYCNEGNDLATGHTGNDIIYGWTFNDSLWGGHGQDTLMGDDGNDQLYGDGGNDSLYGGAGTDNIHGGAGNDYVNGDAGNDTIYGDDGNDEVFGSDGADLVYGDAGNDTVGGGIGNDTIFGWTGNDHLFGNENDDILTGDAGLDYLAGEAGNDGLYGNDDNDTLVGGAGNDWLEGGAGNDYFNFAAGSGVDTINGFDGEGAAVGDIIFLSGITGLTTFAQVQAATTYNSSAGTAVINLGGGHNITVVGVTEAFASNDFLFS